MLHIYDFALMYEQATEVQKEVLDVLVALVSLGHVHTPMQYFISSICSYDAVSDYSV